MHVFTTIFLINTLRATINAVEETPGFDQNRPALAEFKRAIAVEIMRLKCDEAYEEGERVL